MNGLWVAAAILIIWLGSIDRVDCALKIAGACEAIAAKRLAAEKAYPSKKD